MKILPAILVIFFLLISCQDIKRTEKPEDLIPKEKMVDIITELYLLNGARTYNKKMLEEKGIDPDEYIRNKYDIDSLQLVRSNNYYAENYEEYEAIYLKVKEKMDSLQTYYDTLRIEIERRRDSIRKLDPKDSLRRLEARRRRDSIINFPDTSKTEFIPYPVSSEDSVFQDPF
ncbi:MAG TPA: DUF4296 domain-containing protein [Salinimicrobium sp.]|nr:DUF4296 domain-containing protein [Salinimicrobium sp.]